MYRIYMPREWPKMTPEKERIHLDLMVLINGGETMGTGMSTLQEVIERVIHSRDEVIALLQKLKS